MERKLAKKKTRESGMQDPPLTSNYIHDSFGRIQAEQAPAPGMQLV